MRGLGHMARLPEMNPVYSVPPASKDFLTPPEVLVRRLETLIGKSFLLTRKSRTDGSNLRKLVAETLEQGELPPPCAPELYSIVPSKRKGVPKILLECIDTYIVTSGTSYNLQVWNRNPAADSVQVEYANGDVLSSRDVRFVIVRVDTQELTIRAIFVLTPDYIVSNFGPFGVKTLKYQLIVTKTARNTIYSTVPPLLFYPDTQEVSAISTKTYITPQGSIHDEPVPGRLLSIEVMHDRLVHEILGAKLDAGATKLRGQALELRVARHLGYTPRPEELLAGG